MAIRWLIEGAKQRSERTMSLRIYNELKDAYNKKGFVFKKKYEWHNRLLSSQLKSFPLSKVGVSSLSLRKKKNSTVTSKSSKSSKSTLPNNDLKKS